MTPRNADYRQVGTKYTHVMLWRDHHGAWLDPKKWVIHHVDHDKTNNTVCTAPEPCLNWQCGNLHAMTRADHIREHRPGRMGGRKIPNKRGVRRYYCGVCGKEKSRHGDVCKVCRYLSGAA